MAQSKTDLANLALGLLDEDPIMDLEQDEQKARVLRIHLPNSLDNVLCLHRWNSATKRQVLTLAPETPAFGTEAVYTLPADCLRVLEVVESESGRKVERWSVEAGRTLLTEAESPGLVYTARVDQIPHLAAWIAEAVAYHLAARVARAITGSESKGRELREEFERVVLPEARQRDAQEGMANENHPMRGILRRSGVLRARFAGQPGELDNEGLVDLPETPIP